MAVASSVPRHVTIPPLLILEIELFYHTVRHIQREPMIQHDPDHRIAAPCLKRS
jgi:hypothetical protein